MKRIGQAAVVALVLLFPPCALAADLGPLVPGLSLTPFVSENVEYQANVFQTPGRAKQDVIVKTIPGFLLEYVSGPHSVSAGYRAEILRFLDLETQNNEHHIGGAQVRLDFPRLFINVRDDYTLTSDPPGSELTGRVESTTNVLSPEVAYRLPGRFERLYIGVNYNRTGVDFEKTLNDLDRDEDLISGLIAWRFLPKSDLRLSYGYGWKVFDRAPDRDVSRQVVTLALSGELTAKISSTFRLGVEEREPDKSGRKEFFGLVTGGDWTFKPRERTAFSLATNRSVEESTFGNSFFYVSTNITLQMKQEFGRKVSTFLKVNAGVNDYPTKETLEGRTKFRNDTLFGWGAGVEYNIQPWLRVGTEYSHARRESNFDDFNYKDDRITGKITIRY